MIKICKVCQIEFKTSHSYRVTCSRICKGKASIKPKNIKICPICKITFYSRKSGHENKIYCSRICRSKAKSIEGNIWTNCLYCKKDFIHNKNEKNKKFCNWECYRKFYELKERFCEVCKKQIIKSKKENVTYWKIKRFCSPKCRGIYSAKPRRKHSDNSNKFQRWLFKREILKKVFERDNYTCQICGSNKDLQVDHIQRWADYVELRFDINNCRTLCRPCHYFITIGRKMPKDSKWGLNMKGKVI